MAIVEHFRAAGAFTLISTHLMALKIYGASTEGVVNGSMGFDEQTFEPTYHLQLGLPGKSAGLEIATRLGMPEDIMLRARRFDERPRARRHALPRRAASPHRRDAVAREASCARSWRSSSGARRSWRASGKSAKAAKLKELERRTDQALAQVRRAGAGDHRQDRADRRTSARPSRTRSAAWPRPSASCARISRPPCSPREDDSRQGRIQPLRIEEGARVRLKRCARAGARAAADSATTASKWKPDS